MVYVPGSNGIVWVFTVHGIGDHIYGDDLMGGNFLGNFLERVSRNAQESAEGGLC